MVGSINMDTVLGVERLPAVGETVTAHGHFTNPGGKGANQAVAAARLGRSVSLVGCVGNDDVGRTLVAGLIDNGIDTSGVSVAEDPSGMAVITVGSRGENTIVVSPGANRRLTPEHVHAARPLITEAGAVMVQLEIPLESVRAALELATGLTVLNPAPARRLDASLLEAADIIVPNETELASLLGSAVPTGPEEAVRMAAALGKRVVVTMGERGAVYVEGDVHGHVPAPVVEAVDTTAAGDAFCAALVDALVGGAPLREATAWGVRAGSLAVTRPGAQASLPTREEMAA